MNKDQIAIYLNEHPEFFNEYPELLHKIKQIDESDLPLQPLKTLSIADRILKRAHDDKEHMRSKLEWFVEITQANEKIQEHLFEIERAILSNLEFSQMILHLKEEILSRFSIDRVLICLMENSEHFLEEEIRDRQELEEALRFVEPAQLQSWFPDGASPALHSEMEGKSEVFTGQPVNSEALIPITIRGEIVGTIVLGSLQPFHFYEGLRTDYLERMAQKLGMAIDNLMLLERLRRQPVLDKATGLYNASYLEPVLEREFDRAKRYAKPLSAIKIHIDTPGEPSHTDEESRTQLKAVGRVLSDNSRGGDIMIRIEEDEFLILLPGLEIRAAQQVADRIHNALAECSAESRIGVASLCEDQMNSADSLMQTVNRALMQARENGTQIVAL